MNEDEYVSCLWCEYYLAADGGSDCCDCDIPES